MIATYPRGGCPTCTRNVHGIGDALIVALAWRTLAAWWAGNRDLAVAGSPLFAAYLAAVQIDTRTHRGAW